MYDIEHTYTIQWVGPFHSLAERDDYFKKVEMCDSSLFSFYYFRGNKKGRGYTSRKFYDYFGIHKYGNIATRLNKSHEHFRDFKENTNLDIWIGSFANTQDQEPQNIKDVETVFISTYKPSENKYEKYRKLEFSICIINLWYKVNETPWKRKPASIIKMKDVLVCEVDEHYQRFLSANLKEVKPKANKR